MSDSNDWAFPTSLRPRSEELAFDLDAALESIVLLRAEIPDDAFTASILGTERVGNGIVIGPNGLVLTIGYLITEASAVWLTTNKGTLVAGDPLAYDQPTGFGLVQPLGRLGVPHLERGSAAACKAGDKVVVAGHGGRAHALQASVLAKREFAGYWEYVLDEAIFTLPAHPQWGGAALIGADGRLLGVGSLLVEEKMQGETAQGNMIVPVDLLDPILDNLLRTGSTGRSPRPWLGMYTTEVEHHLVVAGLAERGPGAVAGLQIGDMVLEVAGHPVSGLAGLFRSIWQLGDAGVDVPLVVTRKGEKLRFTVHSRDRADFLKKRSLH
ncbi:MAG TPA: S1C family serine protease [Burkholderiales bacterium]|jgi:S1-C subfamily serine protease|nr:S1C family serine protease [Burkholderiales bacterium]